MGLMAPSYEAGQCASVHHGARTGAREAARLASAWGLTLSLTLASPVVPAQMEPQIGPPPTGAEGQAGWQGGLRTLKLTPRTKVTPLEVPEPEIPLSAIRPFIEHSYVLQQEEIDQAPYVVAFPDRRVLGGTGDRVYVRGLRDRGQGRYRLVRPGGPYRDPRSGDILGYQAQHVAEVSLERPGDPAVLRIEAMSQEVASGDRLVAVTVDEPLLSFTPRPAPPGREGQILAVLNGVSQIGSHNVVVIDLGTEQGVAAGQLFDIFNGGEQVQDRVRAEGADWNWKGMKFWSEEFWYGDYRTDRWISDEYVRDEPLPLHRGASPVGEDFVLPLERAGRLMVFQPFARVSFALVMEAMRPMHVQDRVLAPRP